MAVIPGTFKGFSCVEDLVSSLLCHPRRVIYKKEDDCLTFEDDRETVFEIDDADVAKTKSHYLEGDVPFRTQKFLDAFTSNKLDEWCEGINYGKPDFKVSGAKDS